MPNKDTIEKFSNELARREKVLKRNMFFAKSRSLLAIFLAKLFVFAFVTFFIGSFFLGAFFVTYLLHGNWITWVPYMCYLFGAVVGFDISRDI